MSRFTALLFVFALFPLQSYAGGSSQHGWQEGSLSKALQQKKSGKVILLQVHAHWCSPCNQLRYEVLETPRGKKLLQQVTGMLVDFETPAGRTVTKKYSILGLPTTLVLSATGKEMGRIQGYPGRNEWLTTVQELLRGKRGLAQIASWARKNPTQPKWQLQYAQSLLFLNQPRKAHKLLHSLMQRNDRWGHAAIRSWGRYLLRVKRDAVKGTSHFLGAWKKYKHTGYSVGYLYWAAKGYQMQKKTDKVLQLLQGFVEKARKGRKGQGRAWMIYADFLNHYKYPVQQTESIVRKALRFSPRSTWLHYLLAQTLVRKGDLSGARKAIAFSTKSNPKMALYRYYKGKVEGLWRKRKKKKGSTTKPSKRR